MLDEALDAISAAVAAGSAGVGGCDIAVATGGSGRRGRGQGHCWGAVGRPGSMCCRSRGVWGWFEAGDEIVVAIVNDVGVVDGADGAIASSDVAVDGGGDRVAVGSSRGVVCVPTSTVEGEVVWVPESIVVRSVD